jgi:DNA-directed RNA polymerase subunit M/transcription elongation factor TFIIS
MILYNITDKQYCIIIIDKMPKVEGNGIPSSLHYALTDSQCNKCGAHLDWKADFDDSNSPKYIAKHCDQDYKITIDSVRVETVKHNVEQAEGEGKELISKSGGGEENKRRQQEQPKSLTMAELLKDKESILKKTKLGDGSNIKAEDR